MGSWSLAVLVTYPSSRVKPSTTRRTTGTTGRGLKVRTPRCAILVRRLDCSESNNMPAETATHIWLDDRGFAWIDQTNVKVVEVVMDKLAHGSSPEEMHFQYPHLSLAQIHAALAYYYDHQIEIDAQIEQSLRRYEEFRAQGGETPLRKKLRELGKLK